MRREAKAIGNFWVDLTRATLYVLLPLSVVIVSTSGRRPQSRAYVDATTLEGAKQTIAQGPVASQEAIMNDGGVDANRRIRTRILALLTNLIELVSIFVIAAGLTTLGRMVRDECEGWLSPP